MAGMKEFLEKIVNDEKFVEDLNKAKNGSEFNKKLKSAGFELSPKEFVGVVKAVKAKQTGALADEDLDSVSGGVMECAVLPDNWRELIGPIDRIMVPGRIAIPEIPIDDISTWDFLF